MLIIHRATPLATGVVIGLGIAALMTIAVNPFLIIGITLLAAFLLLARLVGLSAGRAKFWILVGIPMVLVFSTFIMTLFLESDVQLITIGIATALLVFFFAEHLFTYIHVPAAYQTYAIEHLSAVLNVLAVFYIAASAYGFKLFLASPSYLILPSFFLLALFITVSSLWVSKIETSKVWVYAVGGAVLLTEFFWTIMYLPTGFITNAALIATILYVYLGIVRAHGLEKLTKTVLQRYVLIAAVLCVTILGTAKWL